MTATWLVMVGVRVNATTAPEALTKVAELVRDLGQPITSITLSEARGWEGIEP